MRVEIGPLNGVLKVVPTPHRDDRGLFGRTFDAVAAAEAGLDPCTFIQDSQSRARRGTVPGTHGRIGPGEGKLVCCAHGAVLDVVLVDAPPSPAISNSSISAAISLPQLNSPCRARYLSGWIPKTELVDGPRMTVDWLKENP